MRDLAAMEATRQSIYTGGDAAIVGREPVVTGAEALIRSLQAEGVEVVFGYPGGAVLSIYDELYRSSLRHILTRHEQGAAHAADAYARATGKPGVCIATSGPGATNLVTGLATAYMDSVPVIAITGQVATFLVGKDAFQEADITGITMPITKHNYLVTVGWKRRLSGSRYYRYYHAHYQAQLLGYRCQGTSEDYQGSLSCGCYGKARSSSNRHTEGCCHG